MSPAEALLQFCCKMKIKDDATLSIFINNTTVPLSSTDSVKINARLIAKYTVTSEFLAS